MEKVDAEGLKRSLNIVDVIGQSVRLKKQGKDYFGCCPFHHEKTPSFSVDEPKQLYHCFGCGASGDVIDFVMEYEGCEFIDAYKILGGQLDITPSKKVQENIKRSASMVCEKVPFDHKQEPELSQRLISKCQIDQVHGFCFYRYAGGFYLPIITPNGEIVNAVEFSHGEGMKFVAGGASYNGFTPIRVNESDNWVACKSLSDGRFISSTANVNVAVCWTDGVMRYICKWNHGGLKIRPVIRDCDDDWLCDHMKWIKMSDDYKLEKMEIRHV